MLAKLYGKSNIYNFKIEIFKNIKAFDFLNLEHQEEGETLCQVINITRDNDKLIGDCKIIGFRDGGVLKNIRIPFSNNSKIEIATDEFIEKIVGLIRGETNDFIGVLEHHPDLKISLDLKKAITKHIAVLAKSGAGKSYTVGVLLEEVMKKNIPIVILDPHNEYSSIKYPNLNKKDGLRLNKFNLKPQGFLERIKEYSPDTDINPQSEPITLDINTLRPQDLIESLPQKLSPAQSSLIFNILSSLNNKINLDELIFNISNEESNSKWSLISMLEQLKKLKLYSSNPTPLKEIVKYKQTSIISLKGVEPYVSETFVSGLLKSLFEARKKEEIPPFLLVLEEAHNFCPEKSFGQLKTSKIIRTIAGEGRKFGIGLCVISQRPAKVDKNVISQCTTQILLKMTNPNDVKSVIASSEGVDSTSENEIQKLNIGTCLLTGVIDIPLKVNIRPRISKHGGDTVDITLSYENELKDKNKVNDKDKIDNKNKLNNKRELTDKSLNSNQNSNNYENTHINKQNYENRKNDNPVGSQISYNGKIEEREEEFDNLNKENKEKPIFHKGKNSEFIQFIAPEIEPEDAKVMLDTNQIEIQLVPATIIKMKTNLGKETNLLFDKVNLQIIKNLFPFKGSKISKEIVNLSNSEKKLLKVILSLSDIFNPAELLLKTDMMFNEILRICDSLSKKSILLKKDRQYEIGNLKFAKQLLDLNFYGQQKFEEISYDKKLNQNISNDEIEKILSIFGKVDNLKDIQILRYVAIN